MKFSTAIQSTVTALALIWSVTAFAQTADFVFANGKIITVNDQFTTVQALAIKGERIIATGTDADIEKFKGPSTLLIDLQRRTVIPGLIDNHAHYMRAAEYWHREVRLDGVTSHKRAMELLSEKVRESKPGEWVVVLGGWSEEQFTDEPRGFSRQELDELAPNNPVGLQLFYFRVYANSAALRAMGIDANTPDPTNIKIEKDGQGQLTGALNGGPAIGLLRSKLGEVARDKAVENARLLMVDLNKMGITAFQDQGGTGVNQNHIKAFQLAHDFGQMTVRSFYNYYEEPDPSLMSKTCWGECRESNHFREMIGSISRVMEKRFTSPSTTHCWPRLPIHRRKRCSCGNGSA